MGLPTSRQYDRSCPDLPVGTRGACVTRWADVNRRCAVWSCRKTAALVTIRRRGPSRSGSPAPRLVGGIVPEHVFDLFEPARP